MEEEEENLKSKKSKPIGGNIDDLSIEDLEEFIQDLIMKLLEQKH